MSDTKQRSVLVLEDERQLAMAVRDALGRRDFNPIVVQTIDDGLKELENLGHVDVIWLDHYLLGTGNGVDFVVKVKNHPNWKNIPIFVVSNTASNENIRSYIQLGVNNYYTKADYNIMQIIDDIAYTLEQGGATKTN
ncbi:MAG: response regulator [Candidatus Nitrotoga sp.]